MVVKKEMNRYKSLSNLNRFSQLVSFAPIHKMDKGADTKKTFGSSSEVGINLDVLKKNISPLINLRQILAGLVEREFKGTPFEFTFASLPINHIQLKRICQCDGGCPNCSSKNTGPNIDSTRHVLRTKLNVSKRGDIYEQEADRIAEHVIGMSSVDNSIMSAIPKDEENIDRKWSACEISNEEEEELTISRKPSTRSNFEEGDEITNYVNSIRSSGGPSLDSTMNEFMGSRFRYDFGNIQIHTDERAARSAHFMNALAYTVGNGIVFGKGQYKPNTFKGRILLSHELSIHAQEPSLYG